MKWLMYLILFGLAAWSWKSFSDKGGEIRALDDEIAQVDTWGDPEGIMPDLKDQRDSLDGDRTLSGILLTFISAGIVGILFVVYLLPFFAQRVTHAVYDSAEMIEKDVMHDARSLVAQGEYEAAIEAFQKAAQVDPLNRLPWVEIAKIFKDNLNDSDAAIQTIRHALESQEWQVNDAAYFLFRLAELYDEVQGDRESAKAIMQQVIQEFEGTRHSANAIHKLHEWSVQEEAAAVAAQEQEYLEQAGEGVPEQQAPLEEEDDAARLAREEQEYLERMNLAAGEDPQAPEDSV